MEIIEKIKEQTKDMATIELVRYLKAEYQNETVFSTSFGIEDQVLAYMIGKDDNAFTIFTLDTGRLFPETYSVWNRTTEKYNLSIQTYYPSTTAVERLVSEKGPLSFYNSVENRKECCFIRKIEPLQRAIKDYKIWVTGVRADQSPNRESMDRVEWDEVNQIIKIHPLFYWTIQEVDDYIKANNIPYNALYDKGFPSIGCQPCTRAVHEGEDFRSGRWWWEDASKKECGLHITTK